MLSSREPNPLGYEDGCTVLGFIGSPLPCTQGPKVTWQESYYQLARSSHEGRQHMAQVDQLKMVPSAHVGSTQKSVQPL